MKTAALIAFENNWTDRRIAVTLLVLSGIVLIAALVVGISDNPPGVALCAVSAMAAILAFAHRLGNRKQMLLLAGAALVGFPVFVVLHNLFYGLGRTAGDVSALRPILDFLHAAFFVVAILVCPPGVIVGAVGALLAPALARRTNAVRAAILFAVSATLIAAIVLVIFISVKKQ